MMCVPRGGMLVAAQRRLGLAEPFQRLAIKCLIFAFLLPRQGRCFFADLRALLHSFLSFARTPGKAGLAKQPARCRLILRYLNKMMHVSLTSAFLRTSNSLASASNRACREGPSACCDCHLQLAIQFIPAVGGSCLGLKWMEGDCATRRKHL